MRTQSTVDAKRKEFDAVVVLPTCDAPTDNISQTLYDHASLLIKEQDLLSYLHDYRSKPIQLLKITNNQGTLIDNADGTWLFTPPKYVIGDVELVFITFDGNKQNENKLLISLPNSKPIPVLNGANFKTSPSGSFTITSQQLLESVQGLDISNLKIIHVSTHQGDVVSTSSDTWTIYPSAKNSNTNFELQFTATDGQVNMPQFLIIQNLPL